MTRSEKPNGIIYFIPQGWRERLYRKVQDDRIVTLRTVDLIGKHRFGTLFTIIYWVGNQREVYVLGLNIKWLRRYKR